MNLRCEFRDYPGGKMLVSCLLASVPRIDEAVMLEGEDGPVREVKMVIYDLKLSDNAETKILVYLGD